MEAVSGKRTVNDGAGNAGAESHPISAICSVRDGLELAALRLRGAYFMRKARSLIRDTTGLELHGLPSLEIGAPMEGCAAQLYGDRLVVHGRKNLTSETTHHEMYHFAQGVSRSATAGVCEREFIAACVSGAFGVSAPAACHRYPGSHPHATASLLWNGVNEAGAYLFGHYSDDFCFADRGDVAFRVISSIEMHVNRTVRANADAMVELLFDPASAPYREDIAMLLLALATATISLERNGFDIGAAARGLLERPESVLARVRDLGMDGARDSLERAAELVDSWARTTLRQAELSRARRQN